LKVIDSVGWIEFFGGGSLAPHYRALIREQSDVLTPTIVMYEVYKRIALLFGENSAKEAVAAMAGTLVVPLDDTLALLAAQLAAKHKLPMADAIVYATGRQLGADVVTSDKHFEGLDGVEYIPRPGLT
jgi:predicted nucleic acid-binding protein